MRHLKLKLKIIWILLTDAYTNSDKEQCWWLWGDDNILVTFGKENYHRLNKEDK